MGRRERRREGDGSVDLMLTLGFVEVQASACVAAARACNPVACLLPSPQQPTAVTQVPLPLDWS